MPLRNSNDVQRVCIIIEKEGLKYIERQIILQKYHDIANAVGRDYARWHEESMPNELRTYMPKTDIKHAIELLNGIDSAVHNGYGENMIHDNIKELKLLLGLKS